MGRNFLLLFFTLSAVVAEAGDQRVIYGDLFELNNGTRKVTMSAPTLAGDTTFQLPPNNGTSGYVLQSNGAGATTWVAQTATPWATPGAIGSTTPNSGAFTTLSAANKITGAEGSGTNNGFGFAETGSDTGMFSPTDGELDLYTNGVLGFGLYGNLIRMRGVDYAWPTSQGAASTVLTNDGSGNLDWAPATGTPTGPTSSFAGFNETTGNLQGTPNFGFDANVGHGLQHNATVDPSTSFVLHAFDNAFNPSTDQTGVNVYQYQMALGLGNDDAGFSIDADNSGAIAGLNIAVDGAHKLDWGTLQLLNVGANFGNGTDAQTGVHFQGITNNITANSGVTVTDAYMFPSNFNAAAGSTVGNFHLFYDTSNFGGDLSNYDGVDIANGTYAHVSNNVNGFTFSGNWTLADASFTGFNVSSNGGTVGGYYNSFRSGGSWTNFGTGGAAYEDSLQITGVQANQYTSFNGHPVINESHGITGMEWGPTITTLTGGNASGINLHPSVTATGNESVWLVFCDMTNVVVNTGTKKCLTGTGDIDLNGRVNANVNVPVTDTGGQVTPIHNLASNFSAGDGVTIANAENFGFSPLTNITVGDGSHLTSGPFGAGINSEGFISLINVGTGSEIGDIGGSFAVGVLVGGSGTVHNAHGYRVAFVNGGGAETVEKIKAFEVPVTGGSSLATTEWGAYIAPTWTQNYMGGHLKVGGSDTTTARAEFDAGSGIGVVIDSTLSADPFEIKTGGVAKWYIDSSLNTWAYGHIIADEGGSGSAAGPVYSFNSSTSSGMYLSSGPSVGVSTGGTERGKFSANGLEVAGGARLNTAAAKPTCDSSKRGTLYVEQGGAGVTDTFYACLKSAADTYSWISVVNGG